MSECVFVCMCVCVLVHRLFCILSNRCGWLLILLWQYFNLLVKLERVKCIVSPATRQAASTLLRPSFYLDIELDWNEHLVAMILSLAVTCATRCLTCLLLVYLNSHFFTYDSNSLLQKKPHTHTQFCCNSTSNKPCKSYPSHLLFSYLRFVQKI